MQITCLEKLSSKVAEQEFESILFFQLFQLWSLYFIFQKASILSEKFLQVATVTTVEVKGSRHSNIQEKLDSKD